jgi:NAD(P) transhydrogenase subunit alpha
LRIGILKETTPGETRVALTPTLVSALVRDKHEVVVEQGAGLRSSFSDDEYAKAGSSIVADAQAVYQQSDIVFKVQPPRMHPTAGRHEAELVREGSAYVGFLSPLANLDAVRHFAKRRVTVFAMEFIPRITRAQSMDALSSMATVGGYKAVLIAADRLPKMFPLLMTAAGTVPPATVLILGAGVAGLQAIATAKRLGAKVEAFDPRPAVKEQVKSLGATFVEMEMPEDAETAGGYAKELSPEFIKKEMEAIGSRLPKVDVVISTAQVFGKKAPLLMTKEMVEMMRPGTVIVDLAAEQGGNCELTVAGKTVEHKGVSIIGAVNLPASIPIDASQMYARNLVTLFRHLYGAKDGKLNFEDEITKGSCITHDGNVVNEMVKNALNQGGTT